MLPKGMGGKMCTKCNFPFDIKKNFGFYLDKFSFTAVLLYTLYEIEYFAFFFAVERTC